MTPPSAHRFLDAAGVVTAALLLAAIWRRVPQAWPRLPESWSLWLVQALGATDAEAVADIEMLYLVVLSLAVVLVLRWLIGRVARRQPST